MWVLLVSGRASHVQCYCRALFLSWTPDLTSQGWRLTLRQPVLPCLLRVSTSLPACPAERTGDPVCHVPRNSHSLVAACSTFSFASGVTGRWVCPRRSGRCLVPWKLAGCRGWLACRYRSIQCGCAAELRLCALTNRPTVFQSFS
jgi:hypothetical protein